MNIFFTADLHLGHDNIRRHCRRPFGTVEEMDEAIIANWNGAVKPNDLVYIVGDFAWRDHHQHLVRLKGKKILIKGNHDKMSQDCLRNFTEVHQLLARSIEKHLVVMCHYCMTVWPSSCHGAWHLYGHSHGRIKELPDVPRCDVGVDVWDFAPVPWEAIKRKLVGRKRKLTILLFSESLAQRHWGRKQFMDMHRVELHSELDVTVFDRFNRELEERMSAYLKDHRDPDDVYLESLIKEYYPKARAILKAVYRERYPRAWRRKWSERSYERPRIKVDRKRRYDMPEPLGLWGSDISQQFYFMNGTRTFGRGCGSGSGSREVHSYFALAFLELQRRGLCIPTYVLVYDRDNRLRFVDAWDLPLVLPNDIGSNCDVDHRVIRKLMDGAWKITATRRRDWTGIAKVSVWMDREPVEVSF